MKMLNNTLMKEDGSFNNEVLDELKEALENDCIEERIADDLEYTTLTYLSLNDMLGCFAKAMLRARGDSEIPPIEKFTRILESHLCNNLEWEVWGVAKTTLLQVVEITRECLFKEQEFVTMQDMDPEAVLQNFAVEMRDQTLAEKLKDARISARVNESLKGADDASEEMSEG